MAKRDVGEIDFWMGEELPRLSPLWKDTGEMDYWGGGEEGGGELPPPSGGGSIGEEEAGTYLFMLLLGVG